MKLRFNQISCIFFSLAIACNAFLSAKVTLKDVKPAAEELFSYHVEHHNFTPMIANRCFKTLIYRFDPERLLLLKSEIKPYFNIDKDQISLFLNQYNNADFSQFLKLNKTIETAIQRSRKIRSVIRTNLISSSQLNFDITKVNSTDFSEHPDDIYQRTSKLMQNWLVSYAKSQGKKSLNPEERHKILNFYEKKRRQHEDFFLTGFGKSEEKLALNILKAISASLDAHSMFYSDNEATNIRNLLKKQICGIGIALKEGIDGPVITSIIPNSPAHVSDKLEVGDLIKEVNGKSVSRFYFKEIMTLLSGKENSTVSLTLQKKTKEMINVTLARKMIILDQDRIQVASEPFGDGIIGKITLSSFYDNFEGVNVERDLRQAIKSLRSNSNLHGLVIDMRKNAGGFLNQAIKVAGLFVHKGVVVIGKYADGKIQYNRNIDPRNFYDGPLVVLTSKASASAAEIVAQALKDEGNAVIIGDERTYGKGSMQYQTITDPTAKHFYKVTIGRYYTVSGNSTQLNGVTADIVVPTKYNKLEIGERYLRYPLANEPLLNRQNIKNELQQIFDQFDQRPKTKWEKMIPQLQKNSQERLARDKNFQTFLVNGNSGIGSEDLHLIEATNVLKDMIYNHFTVK